MAASFLRASLFPTEWCRLCIHKSIKMVFQWFIVTGMRTLSLTSIAEIDPIVFYSELYKWISYLSLSSIGIEKQGAPGFFKGLAKGTTGILIKPLGGVFDSVSVVFDGCRRITTYGVTDDTRTRLPRHCLPNMVKHPVILSSQLASGWCWLKGLWRGRLSTHFRSCVPHF